MTPHSSAPGMRGQTGSRYFWILIVDHLQCPFSLSFSYASEESEDKPKCPNFLKLSSLTFLKLKLITHHLKMTDVGLYAHFCLCWPSGTQYLSKGVICPYSFQDSGWFLHGCYFHVLHMCPFNICHISLSRCDFRCFSSITCFECKLCFQARGCTIDSLWCLLLVGCVFLSVVCVSVRDAPLMMTCMAPESLCCTSQNSINIKGPDNFHRHTTSHLFIVYSFIYVKKIEFVSKYYAWVWNYCKNVWQRLCDNPHMVSGLLRAIEEAQEYVFVELRVHNNMEADRRT